MGATYISLSLILLGLYCIPIIFSIPLLAKTAKAFKEVDHQLFKQGRCKVVSTLVVIEAFLTYRVLWYIYIKIRGHVLTDGEILQCKKWQYCGEILLICFIIYI